LDCHSLEIGLSQSNFLDRVSQIFSNEAVQIFFSVYQKFLSQRN
jgi:hypothetical protein